MNKGEVANWRERATVTVDEYAAIVGVSRATAYAAVRAGEVAVLRVQIGFWCPCLRSFASSKLARTEHGLVPAAGGGEMSGPFYLNAAQMSYGGMSDMALWRWLQDKELGFPKPYRINRRRFWKACDLTALERTRRCRVGEDVRALIKAGSAE